MLGPNGVLEGAKKGVDRRRHELDQPDGVAEGRRRAARPRASTFSTRRSAAASRRRSTARWRSWSAASKDVFDKMEPILKTMGSTVTLTGKIGAGNVTKLANQIMVAVQHRGDGRSACAGDQGRTRSRSGLQRGEGRSRRQHRAEREGADGVRRATSSPASASGCIRRIFATRCWPPSR